MVDPPNQFAVICAFLASMTSFLVGCDIGVMSGAIIYIRRDLHITDVQVEILMWIINLYSLLGSFLAGRTSDWIGRRYTIVLAGGIFFVGIVLIGLSPNYAFLMFGHCVASVGVGFTLMIAPVYAAEISPTSSRGFFTSIPELSINYGILVGYIFHLLLTEQGWSPSLQVGLGVVPSVLFQLGVLAMPESPCWLVMRGRLGDARRVLQKISNSEQEVQQRLVDIKSAVGIPESCNDDVIEVINKQQSGKGKWKEMFITATPAVRHIIVAVISIHFFQQAIGLDSVILHSPTIFEKAGITNRLKILITLVVLSTKMVFILVTLFSLDQFGRRPMLLTSFGGLIVSLFTLAMCLTIIGHSDKKVIWAIVLGFVAVLSSVASFSIGVGTIGWVYCTEVLPLRLRAQGAAMGVVVNRTISGVISMTFLSLSKAITIGGAFFLYGTIATIGWIFFFIVLPETQGKTLEEMEASFGSFRAKPKPNGIAKAPNSDKDGNNMPI
ncbi:hypothetical protein K1719_005026 [Acacia pycnantha]|nr:hypothetical protein K1719_005026 [Acacia pycnantha]